MYNDSDFRYDSSEIAIWWFRPLSGSNQNVNRTVKEFCILKELLDNMKKKVSEKEKQCCHFWVLTWLQQKARQ